MLAVNNTENIEEYKCLPHKVKLVALPYNVDNGDFLGFEKRLAFIMIRGDNNEAFFSYGYDKAKSKKTLFCL